MAHKKAGGSTTNGRDSRGQRIGVKLFGGQFALEGAIIVRQRGNQFYPGNNVGLAKDHTLFASTPGIVKFTEARRTRFSGHKFRRIFVHIETTAAANNK